MRDVALGYDLPFYLYFFFSYRFVSTLDLSILMIVHDLAPWYRGIVLYVVRW